VYFGGPGSFDTGADGILTNSLSRSSFGRALASASDFNGDGFSDLLVGAPSLGIAGANGTAYLYFGGSGSQLDATPDMSLSTGMAGDQFGGALSSAGDVNADGFSDLVIGAATTDSVGVDTGRVYVFHGGKSGPRDVPHAVLDGKEHASLFGRRVSDVGDVDGNGFADIIVDESVYDDRNGVQTCTSRIFSGGIEGTSPESVGGIDRATTIKCSSLSIGAGDLNGDGFADIVNSLSTRNTGIANVYLGGSPFEDTIASSFELSYIRDISAGRDLNGDQVPDIALIDGEGTGCKVQVAFGVASGTGYGAPQQVRSGLDCILARVAVVPDVNGDGIDDLTIGLVNESGGAGQIFLYLGSNGASLDLQVDAVLTGAAGDYFGSSIATP
jgi:FG-GAP repeat